jgi:hypothetical protein
MNTHEHSGPEYNPHSFDAVAAKLFAQLDGQDTMLRRIEARIAGQSEDIGKLKAAAFRNKLMAMSGLAAAGHHISALLFK